MLRPIITVITVVFIIAMFGIYLVTRSQIGNLISEQEQSKYEMINNRILNDIDGISQKAKMALVHITSNPEIQKAFAERDRVKLQELTMGTWEQVKGEGVEQFQFHIAPAIAFFRLHSPQKYGDDLSTFRATIVEANKSKKIVAGLEEGKGGVGFRIVAPMYYNGQYADGSVEYGMSITKDLLNKWKESTGGDVFFYLDIKDSVSWNKVNDKSFLIGTAEQDTLTVDSNKINAIINRDNFGVVNNGNNAAIIIPVKDYRGNTIAYVKCNYNRSSIISQYNRISYIMMIICLLTLIVILVATYIILSKVLNPINALEKNLAVVANGDLTMDISMQSKELGALAAPINKMVSNLKEIIAEISDSSTNLVSYCQELSANAEETSAIATETNVKTTNTTTTVEKTVNNTLAIKEAILDASKEAEKGQSTIELVSGTMNDISTATNNITNVIKELNANLAKIGSFVESITAIAEQTNLLALNAAIEAARAGENGKGFSVVAEEVRKLAEESGNTAKQIKYLVGSIQNQSDHAVQEMVENIAKVEQGVAIVNNAGQSFDNIISKVLALTYRIEQITEGVKEIYETISDVSQSTEESTAAMEEVASSVQLLTQLSEKLNRITDRFRV